MRRSRHRSIRPGRRSAGVPARRTVASGTASAVAAASPRCAVSAARRTSSAVAWRARSAVRPATVRTSTIRSAAARRHDGLPHVERVPRRGIRVAFAWLGCRGMELALRRTGRRKATVGLLRLWCTRRRRESLPAAAILRLRCCAARWLARRGRECAARGAIRCGAVVGAGVWHLAIGPRGWGRSERTPSRAA